MKVVQIKQFIIINIITYLLLLHNMFLKFESLNFSEKMDLKEKKNSKILKKN